VLVAIALAIGSGGAWAAEGSGAEAWFHALKRFEWQIADTAEAAGQVAQTAMLTEAAGRPRALSGLRGDVAVLDRHIERLERRLQELERLPIPEDPPPAEDQ
jgi:ubiquinone biosynthesis protein UbiJ